MKQHKFAIIIAIILFIIPFFWLKPGEMNLGGDSGRLYFYDPESYLNLRVLYNYLGSGTGTQLTYYIYLPYVTLLFLLKLIFRSPTILISFFNGITLSVGFFSIYLIVKELLKEKENAIRPIYIEFSSIIAGLFYILSQISIYSGWEKPTITFNQLFLNPFMAFLLLKFMVTQKIKFMILAIFTTLIFTPNFSIVGAPPFFAFYPITMVFIFVYAKFIRNVSFNWRLFIIGITLFLFIHAFHLINSVGSIFSPGSAYYQSIFAQDGGAGARNGSIYFTSVAAGVKVSRIWMSLAQDQSEPYYAIFIVIPLILIASFFLNRGRTLLLTGLFFLIVFFFASAVTEIGRLFYQQLFKIPGFNIFRNFYGQWSYVLYFFYAIIFGLSLAIVLNKIKRKAALFLFSFLGVIIVGFGLRFLTGSISIPTYPQNVRFHFRIDPVFEQVLQYFRLDPVDGKVLMFPLTAAGYQILQGKDGGIYKGLPMISYLGTKSEFGGYETLRPFQDIFINAMRNYDYETIEKIISVLNIRWVFYNSDPYIYGKLLPSVYSLVSEYAPKNQEGYKAFIEGLPITKPVNFGKRYYIYSVNEDIYLPHIFTTEKVSFTNNQIPLIFDSNLKKDIRQAVIPIESTESKEDPMIIYGRPKSFLAEFLEGIKDNSHFSKYEPFISRSVNDLSYPLIVLKEKYDLNRVKNNPVLYYDYSFLLLSKRIRETQGFGSQMQIGQRPWREPMPWEINRWSSYNSWSASLGRFEDQVNEIVNWIDKSGDSDEDRMLSRLRVNEQLYQHEITLLRIIYDLNKENNEKKYLLNAANEMFDRLYKKVGLSVIDPSLYAYLLLAYANREGRYDIYLPNKNIKDLDQNQVSIKIENKIIKSPFADIKLDGKSELKIELNIPTTNLLTREKWNNNGVPVEGVGGITTIVLNNILGDLANGFTLEIPNWTPESTYLISFDYNTQGDDFIFSLIDKKPTNDVLRKIDYKLFFEKRLNSKGFKKHQSIIYAEKNSEGGFLKIVPFYPKYTGSIQIKNLVVQKINYPQLVFKKIVPPNNNIAPHTKFRKINSTKYALDIKGASTPYTLIFLESFNKNWKLTDIAIESNSNNVQLSSILGHIGSTVTGFFMKDILREDTVASYFNGELKEEASLNNFLVPSTFETWGRKTIAYERHSEVFGYANAWLIKPEDLDGKKDYTLILELKTQKMFYPALSVSLLTVAILLGYSVRNIFIWLKKR